MVSSGYLSLLYSISDKPLEYWSKQYSQTGRIRKILDGDLLENVVELQDLEKSSNENTFITCPASPRQLLDIRLPYLIIVMKNMNVECSFQIQIIDTNDIRHHFYFCNEGFESNESIRTPMISRVELKLESGWNRVELDLENLTQRAFHSHYKATQRLAICANCRLRRIYFVDRHYADMEISPALCQAFFHYYMTKWGIYMSEKTTQTNDTSSNTKKTELTTRRGKQLNHYQFLKSMQIKSGKLINDFFRRTNKRLSNVIDIKSKIRLLHFTIPKFGGEGTLAAAVTNEVDRKLKRHGNTFCSRAQTSKVNELESPDSGSMKVDQCNREKSKSNATMDDWNSRYQSEEIVQEKLLKPVSTVKQNQEIFESNNSKKTRKQDKPKLKNCKDLSRGKKSSLSVNKITLDKPVEKNITADVKRKEGINFRDAVKSLTGTLNEIQQMSDLEKFTIKNRPQKMFIEKRIRQRKTLFFEKMSTIGEQKDLKTFKKQIIAKDSGGDFNNEKNSKIIKKAAEVKKNMERNPQTKNKNILKTFQTNKRLIVHQNEP